MVTLTCRACNWKQLIMAGGALVTFIKKRRKINEPSKEVEQPDGNGVGATSRKAWGELVKGLCPIRGERYKAAEVEEVRTTMWYRRGHRQVLTDRALSNPPHTD